jgi:hypothetical protein
MCIICNWTQYARNLEENAGEYAQYVVLYAWYAKQHADSEFIK